jgi:hypothetical protein
LPKLEDSLKRLIANCLERTPEYTYAKLKELKDKKMLIQGQQYMLIDYIATVSLLEAKLSGLEGYVQPNSTVTPLYIVLTAKTTDTFYTQAKAFYKNRIDVEYDIDYHFDRPTNVTWCLQATELDTLLVSPTGNDLDSFRLTLWKYEPTRGIVYTRDNSPDLYVISGMSADKTAITVTHYVIDPDTSDVQSVESDVTLNVLSYEDSYKGVITRMLNMQQRVEPPFDHCIRSVFSVSVHDYSIRSNKAISPAVRNVYVSPYVVNSKYCIPRISIQNSNVQLRGSCTHIIIDCLTSNGIDLTMSSNVYLAQSMPPVKACLTDVCVPKGNVYFQGPAFSRCVFIVDDANHFARCTAYQATDVNLTCSAVHAVLFLPYTNGDLVNLSLSGNNWQPIYVSRDSEGNIRQYNPADIANMEFVVAGALNDLNKRLLEQ